MNHRRLPAGYRLAEIMDFVRNRKLLLTVNLAGLGVALLMITGALFVKPIAATWNLLMDHWYLWLTIPAMNLAYILLHELTHGIFMYALSGVRPKYGVKLCYAYAGSSVWFDRKSHILIALAPVILWGVILQILCALLPDAWFWLIWLVQIANVSGAAGDIYCSVHLIRLPGDILIQDTGTRMRVMVKKPNHISEETRS